jgi:manganese/zinc/iron transport system permease protein
MTQATLWTITVAAVCNTACALLGCYLVLRRLSLVGDAISHAVLPGLALAFLATGRITGWPIVLGAMALGVLTVFLTEGIHKLAGVPEDASLGVVFTALFALGVILLTRLASRVDLDPGCVLYGLIEFVPLDTVSVLGVEVPRALGTMLPALGLTVGFVLLFWKELKITAFDPELATAMGYSAGLVHYALMALVAGVTVASFEAVGSILVVAMLIVPAATAHLLTDRLAPMLGWSVVVAVLSAVLGTLEATRWNTSVAGMMAVVAGWQFLLAVLLAPRHGLLSKLLRNARLALRIAREDVLGQLYRQEERQGQQAPDRPGKRGATGLIPRLAVWSLQSSGLVRRDEAGQIILTEEGRRAALSLVRAHRLWESYLASELALPLDHLHEPAEVMEHFLDRELQSKLLAQLHGPALDPHGQPIPPLDDPPKG